VEKAIQERKEEKTKREIKYSWNWAFNGDA